MNEGFNQPQNPANRRPRRRKRNFSNQSQGGQQNQGRQSGGGQNRNRNNRNRGPRRSGVFVGPMDHSYRNQGNGSASGQGRYRNGFGSGQAGGDLEPLPPREDAPTRIFAFVDDLFFLAKIQEVGRKLNVKVEFVKSDKEMDEKVKITPAEKPSLVIVDLNSNSIKPISIITKLKSKYKKTTSIVGFVSHVQGDLKVKAQDAGCDVVMPRSAFSQTLPSLLRRHGAPDEPEENFNKV
jgi:CheY-like chemotaxis protein